MDPLSCRALSQSVTSAPGRRANIEPVNMELHLEEAQGERIQFFQNLGTSSFLLLHRHIDLRCSLLPFLRGVKYRSVVPYLRC